MSIHVFSQGLFKLRFPCGDRRWATEALTLQAMWEEIASGPLALLWASVLAAAVALGLRAIIALVVKLGRPMRFADAILRTCSVGIEALCSTICFHILNKQIVTQGVTSVHTLFGFSTAAIEGCLCGCALLIADLLSPRRITAAVLLDCNFEVLLTETVVLGIVSVPMCPHWVFVVTLIPSQPLRFFVEPKVVAMVRVIYVACHSHVLAMFSDAEHVLSAGVASGTAEFRCIVGLEASCRTILEALLRLGLRTVRFAIGLTIHSKIVRATAAILVQDFLDVVFAPALLPDGMAHAGDSHV
jgi:hypothetical protein